MFSLCRGYPDLIVSFKEKRAILENRKLLTILRHLMRVVSAMPRHNSTKIEETLINELYYKYN